MTVTLSDGDDILSDDGRFQPQPLICVFGSLPPEQLKRIHQATAEEQSTDHAQYIEVTIVSDGGKLREDPLEHVLMLTPNSKCNAAVKVSPAAKQQIMQQIDLVARQRQTRAWGESGQLHVLYLKPQKGEVFFAVWIRG